MRTKPELKSTSNPAPAKRRGRIAAFYWALLLRITHWRYLNRLLLLLLPQVLLLVRNYHRRLVLRGHNPRNRRHRVHLARRSIHMEEIE